MTDDAFKELVNLYLDGELSPAEQERLNVEINASPERSRQFHESCRLHEAMQMVLDPQALQPKDLSVPLPWRRIALCLGAAAALALGTVALWLIPQTLADKGSPAPVWDSSEQIGASGQHHFTRNAASHPQASSLAAQLRLAGLMPEMVVARELELRPVKGSALVQRRVIMLHEFKLCDSDVEFITIVNQPTQGRESFVVPTQLPSEPMNAMPSGFESALVSF